MNLVKDRVQFSFPPTFQPGCVGSKFLFEKNRILFIGYNPGEGKNETSQQADVILQDKQRALSEGNITFTEFNDFLGAHLVNWPVYAGKGILSETDDTAIALLPKELRPSVHSVALVNLFPLKTVGNKKALNDSRGGRKSLKKDLWELFVRPMIELLAPNVIVRYPDSDSYEDQLQKLETQPKLIRVWHPSDYNVNTRRNELAASWEPLREHLTVTARHAQPV